MSPFKSLGGHQTLRNLFNRAVKFDSSGRFTSPPPPPPELLLPPPPPNAIDVKAIQQIKVISLVFIPNLLRVVNQTPQSADFLISYYTLLFFGLIYYR